MMTPLHQEFLKLIARSMRFEFHAGDSTWVTPPYATGWRTLPSVIVAQADYTAVIEQPDRPPQKIEAGEAFAIAPQVHHNITMTARRAAYSHWTHAQCEVFPGVSLFYLIELPLVFKLSRARKIGQICQDLGKLFKEEASLASVVKQQALGWSLISTLLQSVAVNEDRIDLVRQASRLSPVLAHIEENLARPISHEALARTASLSPSRFHSVFRSALGCAPYEYVQKVRLKKAQELLIRTDRSIAEIGQEVGHPDPYHFSRTFRQKVGISPAKYRKQMKFGSF
jgi:AraC-like DNA-binding protein